MGDDIEDPEKLKEILGVVATEIPKLVEAITKTIYNTENAQNMAKAVAEFYKSMRAAGMEDEQAFELTQDFMSSFSIGGMISKAVEGGRGRGDIDKLVEDKVREKLKKKLDKLDEDD